MSEEDEIDASKAPLIEHLVELRSRLIKSVVAFLLAFFICFMFAKQIYNILLWPYEFASGFAPGVKLIYTAPQEFLFTQIKLGMFGAAFISFPVVATQVYMFMAPGLYKHEKAAFRPYLVATPVCFLLGGLFVYFVAMPLAMTYFLSMQQAGGDGHAEISLLPKVSEYLSLITTLILAFGVCFQLPVILTLLARIGILTSDQLKKARRYAIVGVFILAAVLTPPDVVSQLALAIPTLLLYEVSVYLVRMVEKRRAAEEAAREASSAS
ncbi:twin-arginine translocase subunit TatC [Aquabacter sediminis]|uniref:twin-arginine translocase subunit TatC n=1 Tax=Aquabacter sediminis TaxID=3029197 RepID=UPI00237DD968|nr:twin-arginine translocase subunit TatC [Aquabacter sp. P-9]MDE1566711.1 twin-arginine translocase subunit TatC [Aquabacter sp. P-9]